MPLLQVNFYHIIILQHFFVKVLCKNIENLLIILISIDFFPLVHYYINAMEIDKNKITFAVRGELTRNKNEVSYYKKVSPFPDQEIGVNFITFDYPVKHTHDYWELYIVINGTVDHFIGGGKKIDAAHGYACLIRPSDLHCVKQPASHFAEPILHLNFVVRDDYIQKLIASYGSYVAELLAAPEDLSFKLDEMTLTTVTKQCIAVQSDHTSSVDEKIATYKIIFSNIFNVLLFQTIPNIVHYPDWLEDLLAKIYNDTGSSGNIKNLMPSISHYSYSRMIKLFKQYTGTTIIEYINNVKIEKAKTSLIQSNKTTLTICNELGFNSLSHFNHLFRQKTGLSPREYRTQNKIKQ